MEKTSYCLQGAWEQCPILLKFAAGKFFPAPDHMMYWSEYSATSHQCEFAHT
jgi:hypothetical protein